jgi:DNA-binding beta-propeller fold protein YncE
MRNHKTRLAHVALFAVLITIVPIISAQAQQPAEKAAPAGYRLLTKIEIGGEGGWDYLTVDSAARRLYVSHATRVVVVDLDKDTVVGEIPNTNGVHGIAIVPELGRGFTSNGRDATATIFDLKTLKVLGQAKTGKNPDAIIYDPASRLVFTFNGASADATAIDAASGAVKGTIALGGKPEFAVADGKGMVFVNIEDKSEVVAIDSKNLTVKAHWPLAPGEEPSGMAMDHKLRRLFIVCANKQMIVMDANSGHVVKSLPIGDGVDAAAFDPETKLAFSSNGEGTLTVVREESADKYSVIETAKTQRGARTMALDPKTHKIYLSTAQFGPPPAPTPERPRPRPSVVPGSFVILVFGR